MSFEVISSGQLRQYIEKVERLEEEKADLMEAIREVFGEAKGNGFDVKIMKQVLKMRKMKQEELMEQEECSHYIFKPWVWRLLLNWARELKKPLNY